MEVTKLTFYDQLPQIKEAIDQATFLSIDCELTGLTTGNDINGYDNQQQYYEKVRRGSNNFLVIQYGLCAFRYDSVNNVFKQQTYNFYTFPKTVSKYVPDQRFLCQASSIEFLVTQGFDFNKLFKQGIPYLNSIQEKHYRESLNEVQKARANNMSSQNSMSHVVPTQDRDRAFVDDINKRIRDFIAGDDEELTLPKCNSFLRLLIHQTIKTNFEDKVGVKVKALDNKDKILVIVRFQSPAQKLEEDNKRTEDELAELENMIGFSKVIKHVVASGKIVIGHNMCLDLLHTIDKFLTPLPEDYSDFKDCAHCLFSNILDTKYMSGTDTFKDLVPSNVLGHLLETVSKEPFTIPTVEIEENGSGYTLTDRKEHEAGYDAYITGLCFLAMWKYIGARENKSDEVIFSNFNSVRPYMNRLFLMRLQDSPYIQLGGKDPTLQRDHVFYLAFPKGWKLGDIMQLFSPFGPVYVSWINDQSAYVGLTKRQQAAVALSTLSQSDTYSIMTYAKRQAQLAGLTTVPISPLPVSRKRLSDDHKSVPKKRKIASFIESALCRRSIDPIPEVREVESNKNVTCDSHSDPETVPVIKPTKKRTVSKTFEEDNSWD